MIYMAVMGHGTVGSGVVEVIHTNKFQVEKNLGGAGLHQADSGFERV